jgi:hypothetical protein
MDQGVANQAEKAGDVRDDRSLHGKTVSQTIQALAPSGDRLTMGVKLCWRRTDDGHRSAAQLTAKIKNQDWEGSLHHFVNNAREDAVTHFVIVQRKADGITAAALVPISELVHIWCKQRDTAHVTIQ